MIVITVVTPHRQREFEIDTDDVTLIIERRKDGTEWDGRVIEITQP